MVQRLSLILEFFRNPNEKPAEDQNISHKLKWLLFFLVLEIPVMYILSHLQSIPEHYGFIDTGQHRIVNLIKEGNILTIIFLVLLLGPFIEELILRLPLQIKQLNFIPFIFLGILLNGISLTHRISGGFSWLIAIPILFSGIMSFLVFNKKYFKKTEQLVKSKYRIYFYTMSVLFALMHLFNYQFNWYLLLFAPLLVLPQFIVGLVLGFLRIKLGFYWGYFFHVLHNAIFLLFFYFFITTPNSKMNKQIEVDGYTLKITEEITSEKIRLNNVKITPNEITISGTFKDVIGRLTRTDVRLIEFRNTLLAEKKISLIFKNDSAYFSNKTDTATQLVLQNLEKIYEFEIKKEKRWANSWDLSVQNEKLFQAIVSTSVSTETTKRSRSFYGKTDTIKANNINSKYLTKLLEKNFNINVNNKIDEYNLFSIEVPNSSPKKLNKYLQENYGLELKQKRAKIEFLIVK